MIVATRNGHLDASYAAAHREVVPGDYAVIEVSDTGTGIPADVIAHVFEPFYTTKDQAGGSGLGLSMVFGFISQSDGHIAVDSELGSGTTVRLFLPRAVTPKTETALTPALTPEPGRARDSHGKTVLVVEDNPAPRRGAPAFLLLVCA